MEANVMIKNRRIQRGPDDSICIQWRLVVLLCTQPGTMWYECVQQFCWSTFVNLSQTFAGWDSLKPKRGVVGNSIEHFHASFEEVCEAVTEARGLIGTRMELEQEKKSRRSRAWSSCGRTKLRQLKLRCIQMASSESNQFSRITRKLAKYLHGMNCDQWKINFQKNYFR